MRWIAAVDERNSQFVRAGRLPALKLYSLLRKRACVGQ
jgi:hypothetical protein